MSPLTIYFCLCLTITLLLTVTTIFLGRRKEAEMLFLYLSLLLTATASLSCLSPAYLLPHRLSLPVSLSFCLFPCLTSLFTIDHGPLRGLSVALNLSLRLFSSHTLLLLLPTAWEEVGSVCRAPLLFCTLEEGRKRSHCTQKSVWTCRGGGGPWCGHLLPLLRERK